MLRDLSDKPDNGKSSEERDRLWSWFFRQEKYGIDQFGIGIVGIGALFFAYSQATFALLKVLIALVGLGGSTTLLMHMYGAKMTRDAIFVELKLSDSKGLKKRDSIIRSRDKTMNRLYISPQTMMISYMVMVSYAWIALIFYRLAVLVGFLDEITRLWVIAAGGITLFLTRLLPSRNGNYSIVEGTAVFEAPSSLEKCP